MLKSFFKIPEANAEIARLTNELSTAEATIKTAEQARTNAVQVALEEKEKAHAAVLKEKDEAHATVIQAKETALVTLTGERDSARTDLATAQARIQELEGKQTTVEKKAAELASTVGNPKAIAAEDPKSEQKNREQLLAEFAAITDPDQKREFWVKHKLGSGRK